MDDANAIRLSEVLSALSYVLDTVEGQPQGHVLRSCFIGMTIANGLHLSTEERSALFYALLLKDAGCSSNSSRLSTLFDTDDFDAKRRFKTVDWSRKSELGFWVARTISPQGAIWTKARTLITLSREGQNAGRELVQIRCERGANIARMLGFPELTALAIRNLDEHWDGSGHPDGVKGKDIPLLARVIGLAQTVEVFYSAYGPNEAEAMIENRRKRWFDPALADLFLAGARLGGVWQALAAENIVESISAMEPEDQILEATPARIDLVARAFAKIIDAKSPFPNQHSEGVARVASALAIQLGLSEDDRRQEVRAGLLHDIGKLGVSNRILDKPGKLTNTEFQAIKGHPSLTYRTLIQVQPFTGLAQMAASHHERLDGSGYYQGLTGPDLNLSSRILAVADVYDALSQDRPYRKGMPLDQTLDIITAERETKLCPSCVDALSQLALSGRLEGYGTILRRDLKRTPSVLDIASQVASAADKSYSDARPALSDDLTVHRGMILMLRSRANQCRAERAAVC